MLTGAAILPACQRAAKFQPCFGRFRAVMVHFSSGFTDRDTVLSDGKVILVFYFDATLLIEINEWNNSISATVKVVWHGIMGSI